MLGSVKNSPNDYSVKKSYSSSSFSDGLSDEEESNRAHIHSSEAKSKENNRRRALTVTQNNIQFNNNKQNTLSSDTLTNETQYKDESINISDIANKHSIITNNMHNRDLVEIYDQIQELETQSLHTKSSTTLDNSDSDYYYDEDNIPRLSEKRHKRHESVYSTASSVNSFESHASNYDLLLARLGSKNNPIISSRLSSSNNILFNKKADQGDNDEIDWEFWSKVISDFNTVARSDKKKLISNVQKGVPPSLRGMVWQLFSKSKNTKIEEQYMQLIKKESVYEKAITRDLSKFTLLDHVITPDQHEALFNILKAYSIYDPEVGYHQGLAYVAAPLILNMPEEEAFCVLVQLLTKYDLRGHFLMQSKLLPQRLYQLDGLIDDNLPHIQSHFILNDITSNTYAYQWFYSLFTIQFPLEVVYRFYDMLFSEGIDVLFQYSVALLQKNEQFILNLEFEELVNHLNNNILRVYKDDLNQLTKDATQIQITPKRLHRLAKEFQSESTRANNEADIIKTLKKENTALYELMKKMESDYQKLNSEHSKMAAELIEIKTETARIYDENVILSQQAYDCKKTLDLVSVEEDKGLKEQIEILYIKNIALVEKNSSLEDQIAQMESTLFKIKESYSESERENEGLKQRLSDLKRLIG